MNRALLVLAAAACGPLTACNSARPAASMGLMRADAPVLTLGAGDTLGRAVYVNDLIIAARELTSTDVAITAAPETGPIGLDD